MAFNDLREYISALENHGEVQRIGGEVDWNLEAGAILRRTYERRLAAPFFEKIKGYPQGYRMFGGSVASFRRIAIALGLDPESSHRTLREEFFKRRGDLIKPRLVKDGPCKENVHTGEDIDLFEFPAPMLHEGDGGRYLCTWHLHITKDPDTGWVNWGTYRAMIHAKDALTGLFTPTHHGGSIYRAKYEPRNEPMPVAIAIGVEPVCSLSAATDVPAGVSEVEVTGALRREPVELIKCETVDLEVPATSEIVIEAEVLPRERVAEGPFGEFTGYMGALTEGPLFRVKCITHRNNPILTFNCEGMPVTDTHVLKSITDGAELLKLLRDQGFPVVDLYSYPESSGMMAVVSVKPYNGNVAHGVASAIWGMNSNTPYVVVVDSDVDPSNLTQVMHAMVTKCHPYRGINRIEHARCTPLTPFLNRHERRYSLGSCVYFDCTWPIDWDPAEVPLKSSFDTIFPREIQERVLKNWKNYGFKEL